MVQDFLCSNGYSWYQWVQGSLIIMVVFYNWKFSCHVQIITFAVIMIDNESIKVPMVVVCTTLKVHLPLWWFKILLILVTMETLIHCWYWNLKTECFRNPVVLWCFWKKNILHECCHGDSSSSIIVGCHAMLDRIGLTGKTGLCYKNYLSVPACTWLLW